MLKLFAAGLGTLLLARALGLARSPALLAAIAFAFGTYLVDWLLHPHVNAYVLLPWLLLAADRVIARARPPDVAALGAATGLAWLGGQPESALMVTLTGVAWIACRRPGPRAALLCAAGLALGVALAAVMLLPLHEALGQSGGSDRSGAPLPLRVLGALALPEYWGRPDRADAVGPVNFTERTLYAGALPLLLAVAGLFARRPRGPHLFFAGLTAVALALAVDTGPVVDLAGRLPLLDRVNLGRMLSLAAFGLALLAGFGLQRLLDGDRRARRRMLVAAVVVAGLPLLATLAAHPGWLADAGTAARRFAGRGTPTGDAIAQAAVLRWLIAAGLGVALIAALARGRQRRPLVAAICALAALDLVVMGWGFNPAIDKAQADPPEPHAVAVMRRIGGRVAAAGGLEPNSASRWGLRDVLGHEQPGVERYGLTWAFLGGSATVSTEAIDPADPRTPKLLDLFGVRALLLPAGTIARPPLGRVVDAGPGGTVAERPTALPEAFVAHGWRASDGLATSIGLLAQRSARASRDAPAVEGAGTPPPGAAAPATPARVASRSDTSVTVALAPGPAGQLVLLDTFYPGWSASVDGRDVPIRAANGVFRAVAVPAGAREVRFSYRPGSVVAGAAISLAALLTIVLLAFVRPRLRTRR